MIKKNKLKEKGTKSKTSKNLIDDKAKKLSDKLVETFVFEAVKFSKIGNIFNDRNIKLLIEYSKMGKSNRDFNIRFENLLIKNRNSFDKK